MTEIEIIQAMYYDGATTKKQMLDALEDGQALTFIGVTDDDQTAVENAHHMVSTADLDEHLSKGGTIGNYQW